MVLVIGECGRVLTYLMVIVETIFETEDRGDENVIYQPNSIGGANGVWVDRPHTDTIVHGVLKLGPHRGH